MEHLIVSDIILCIVCISIFVNWIKIKPEWDQEEYYKKSLIAVKKQVGNITEMNNEIRNEQVLLQTGINTVLKSMKTISTKLQQMDSETKRINTEINILNDYIHDTNNFLSNVSESKD